jgi:hypothetical protein
MSAATVTTVPEGIRVAALGMVLVITGVHTAATRYMLMTQIKPGSVVLLHDDPTAPRYVTTVRGSGYRLANK